MIPVLAIDPGLQGGLAKLNASGALIAVHRMPHVKGSTGIDWAVLFKLLQANPTATVVLEQQMPFAMLDERGKPRVMGSTGAMLENYGKLKLCVEWTIGRYVEVYPQAWQAEYRERTPRGKRAITPAETSDRNKANNARHMEIANALFPGAAGRFAKDWTFGTATAALIGLHYQSRLKRERMEAHATT